MRKKIYPIVVALVLGTSLVFTGCSKSENTTKTKEETQKGGYTFPSELKWSDYITLGTYKDLKGEKTIMTVSDEDVDDEITSELTTQKEVKNRAIKKGDTVTIDYVGKIDGKEFENGSETDAELVVGDYEYLEDLENGLVGLKMGETKTIPATFPKDYGDDNLNGKKAEFSVTVKKICEDKVAKLTEDYVKKNLNYNSIAEYKEAVRKELEQTNEQEAVATLQDDLLTQIAESSTLNKCPDDLYSQFEKSANEDIANEAELFCMSTEEYKKEYYPGDEFDKYVKGLVLRQFIYQAISEKEGITLSDEEYKSMTQDLIDDDLQTSQEVIDYYGEDELKEEFLKQKVLDFISDHAKVTEKQDDGSDDSEDEEDDSSEQDTENNTIDEE